MKHTLILEDDMDLASLQAAVSAGGRFIAFSYTVSLLAITLKRFSSIYYISSPEQFKKYRQRFNTINRVFGWWCIPWGPLRTSQSIRFNNHGALDLTEDVMLNLTEADLRNRVVDIKETTLLYQPPEKSDLKEFQKALTNHQHLRLHIEKLVVGLYINTPEPYFVAGIKTIGDFGQSCQDLEKAFYTRFLKSVHFEFINLDTDKESAALLLKQGTTLMDRAKEV